MRRQVQLILSLVVLLGAVACGSEVATFPGSGGDGGVGASSGGGTTGGGGSGPGGEGGTSTGVGGGVLKGNGAPCDGAAECASGFCPGDDGVCCDAACDGTCEGCAASKTGAADGVCAPIGADSDPDGECSPAFCVGGMTTPAATCNGQGSCQTPPGLTCEPYMCDANGEVCLTSCGSPTDCAPGYTCDPNGACVAFKPLGDPCNGGAECDSGFCSDGVCCDQACSGSCDVCTVALGASQDGTCGPAPFATTGDPLCPGNQVCDGVGDACVAPCTASQNNKRSLGCEYYPTYMDAYPTATNNCFAAFVVNNWVSAAHIAVQYQGVTLNVPPFARIPNGSGPSLTYQPYDGNAGLPPGEVAILFLSGDDCPIGTAIPAGVQLQHQSGIGDAFRVSSDVPVAVYQMNPYGGGSAATTGASLLLPVDAWGDNYMLQTAQDVDIGIEPSLNIVAAVDNTTVTMRPVADVIGGGGLPSATQNNVFTFVLDAGEHAQLTQLVQLGGSVIQTSQPVGVLSGHRCMRAPLGTGFCDHAEQMLPPVRALGSEYVAVMQRPRSDEPGIWRAVGVVNGTQLSYSVDVGGPTSLNRGESVDFVTDVPFVVSSQNSSHPFMFFHLMSGASWTMLTDTTGYGDPDYVLGVPVQQYLSGAYNFFTDPTYPETNLVIVRRLQGGQFHPVDLDCAGVLGGWQDVGTYQWTRIDLTTGDFQDVGSCSTGRRTISSDGPFGLWVWGWGTPETATFTSFVSYGYPAAMSVADINNVTVAP